MKTNFVEVNLYDPYMPLHTQNQVHPPKWSSYLPFIWLDSNNKSFFLAIEYSRNPTHKRQAIVAKDFDKIMQASSFIKKL